MHYGMVPRIDKPISRIVQGTIMVTSKELDSGFAVLDSTLEHGINTLDAAHVYRQWRQQAQHQGCVREREARA